MLAAEQAELVSRQFSAKQIRKRLNPTTVLAHFNCFPESIGRTRIHYMNPFRNDANPSLDVFFDKYIKEWRLGDFAENSNFSTLDLILRFRPDWSLNDALELARLLCAQELVEGPTYRMQERTMSAEFKWPNPKHDHDVARNWHYFYSQAHPSLPPVGFLRTHFDLHIMPNEMVYAPYYNLEDDIIGYKMLSRKGKRQGLGSKPALYGTRRALRMFIDTSLPVIMCEGESDTWVMEYLYGVDYVVVGFPGANQNIDSILGEYPGDTFAGRSVTMCFDGDAAGTSGRTEVAQWLNSKGSYVSIVPLPQGKDVGDLKPDEIRDLFSSWQMPFGERQRIVKVNNLYRRVGSDGVHGAEISNWSLDVEKFLISDEDEIYAFEGTLQPTGRKVVLTSYEFRSAAKIIDWSQANARQFFGTTQDAQKLASYLLDQATLLPVGRITSRVGLHKGDFVWSGGYIGQTDWNYTPRPTGLSLREEQTWVRPRSKAQALRTLRYLVDLHSPEVTMPMLSWMAVAPLRPLFRQFPILHLSGSSGSGKTTLTQVIMTLFSGSQITSNLTTTTPFAISAHFMASNGFPIWFDEYRPGARDDTKQALDQLLRDTYTGQVSTKGAMNANKAEVTEILTDSPVIVTGEDTLSEKSHIDRSIIINIPREGKNQEALYELDYDSPLAHSYLEWLFKNGYTHSVDLPELDLEGMDRLSNRQVMNLRVLQYGYNLLSEYTDYLCTAIGHDGHEHRAVNYHLPERNWDNVIQAAANAEDENPILELIRWGYEYANDVIFDLPGSNNFGISVVELMRLQNAANGPKFAIPFSKHSALIRWLEDNLDATQESISIGGKTRRMVVIPRRHILEDHDEF